MHMTLTIETTLFSFILYKQFISDKIQVYSKKTGKKERSENAIILLLFEIQCVGVK